MDPITTAALIGGGASLVGGFLGSQGQESANKANVEIAKYSTQKNMEEAERNRNFQSQMSNTQHQRAKRDLKLAGINPLLAANAGAGTPGGSQGTAVGAQVENTMAPLSASIGDMGRSYAQMRSQSAIAGRLQGLEEKQLKAEIARTNMDTYLKSKEIPKADAINRLYHGLGKPLMDKIEKKLGTSVKDTNNADILKKLKDAHKGSIKRYNEKQKFNPQFNQLQNRKP